MIPPGCGFLSRSSPVQRASSPQGGVASGDLWGLANMNRGQGAPRGGRGAGGRGRGGSARECDGAGRGRGGAAGGGGRGGRAGVGRGGGRGAAAGAVGGGAPRGGGGAGHGGGGRPGPSGAGGAGRRAALRGRGGGGRGRGSGPGGMARPTPQGQVVPPLATPSERLVRRVCVDGKVVTTGEQRRLLLNALAEYKDGVDLVFLLCRPDGNGVRQLKAALASATSSAFIVDAVMPFVRRLGAEDVAVAMCKEPVGDLLEHCFYRIPGLLALLESTLESGDMDAGGNLGALCWLLLRLAARSAEARHDATVQRLAGALGERHAVGAQQLLTVLSEPAVAPAAMDGVSLSITDVQSMSPGGRHGNDRASYRDVQILPTIEEVNCEEPPYLPPPPAFPPAEGAAAAGDAAEVALAVAAALDRQFRLLREDLVGPLRAALRQLREQVDAGTTLRGTRELPVYDGVEIIGVQFQPRPCVLVRCRLPASHRARACRTVKERDEFWSSPFASRTLAQDALVGLAVAGVLICFGTVVWRDDPALSVVDEDDEPWPTVGIKFGVYGSDVGNAAVTDLLRHVGTGVVPGAQLLQCSSSVFAYEPVLRCLQQATTVPLADQLLLGQPPCPPAYLEGVDVDAEIAVAEAKDGFAYDEHQRRAMELALTSTVSLTHGPPGTGKSHLGIRLVDIIHRKAPAERFLIMCHTNHALDEFLMDLVTHGMTDIVRIGGRSKEEALKKFNLRELVGPRDNPSIDVDMVSRRRCGMLRQQMAALSLRLDVLCKQLTNLTATSMSWTSVRSYLLADDATAPLLAQLEPAQSAFAQVGKAGKALRAVDCWRSWCEGQRDPRPRKREGAALGGTSGGVSDVGVAVGEGAVDLWALTRAERRVLLEQWRDSMSRDVREAISEALFKYESLRTSLDAVNKEASRKVLLANRVVGCTTSGAAKHCDMLADANLSVVVIEEAGEVLEAHVLAALQASNAVKHLLLIGDHLQLRPKLECFELTVSSNGGHAFDRSLLERLIVGGMAHATLQVQHRMRPAISALIRPTYPSLQDAPSTHGRPSIPGVRGNVVFLSHDHPEREAAGDLSRKINDHEVSMVAAIVEYLLRQGLVESDIVVLTPYASQLMELNVALAATVKVVVSEWDADQAARSEMVVSPGNNFREGIRVATVDNFQGEEARVIVASLVRSNQRRSIGFLKDPERVNVLLSRARDGLIMVGSADTLVGSSSQSGSRLWRGVLGELAAAGCVRTSFPAQCQMHGTRPAQPLSTIAAFRRFVPDGGCDQPCMAVLPCGHRCPRRCHPGLDAAHERVRCVEVLRVLCPAGHPVSKPCSSAGVPACPTCKELVRIERDAKARVAKLQHKSDAELKKLEERTKEAQVAANNLQREILEMEALTAATLKRTQAELATERKQRELDLQKSLSAITAEAAVADAQQQAEAKLQEQERAAKAKAAADLCRAREQLAALNAKKAASDKELSRLEQSTRDKLSALCAKVQRVERESAAVAASTTKSSAARVGKRAADAVSLCRDLAALLHGKGDADVVSLLRAMLPDSDAVRSSLGAVLGVGADGVRLVAELLHTPSLPDESECPASLIRGLQLMATGQWLAAHDYFTSPSASAVDAATCGSDLLAAICQLQVTDMPTAAATADADPTSAAADVAPLAFLLHALLLSGRGRASKNMDVMRDAFSAALVCCVHPRTPLFAPCGKLAVGCLRDLAPPVLAPLINPAAVPLAPVSPADRERELLRRCGSSVAIGKLLKLTGLSALKNNFLDLQDRVRLDKERGTADRVQYNALLTGNPGMLSLSCCVV